MNVGEKVKGFFVGIGEFFADVKSEMKKVSYPSRDEVIGTTTVVVLTSIIFAIYLWLADLIIVQLFKAMGT